MLSRVTGIFQEQGVEASGQERFIAETFCTRAGNRAERCLDRLHDNDDERMHSIARLAYKRGTLRLRPLRGPTVTAPVLGWIAVALSGSNTASNAVFGAFQLTVAKLVHAPLLLFPALNSVGAEVGKPVAPQTASVGVSTTDYVRNEGEVIRHNMGWTLIVLAYLIGIGCLWYFLFPDVMKP